MNMSRPAQRAFKVPNGGPRIAGPAIPVRIVTDEDAPLIAGPAVPVYETDASFGILSMPTVPIKYVQVDQQTPLISGPAQPIYVTNVQNNWWDGAYAAYQAMDSDSQAASYTDLSGNYDIVAEVPPTWDGRGWVFNGIDQWIRAPFTPASGSTVIVRFENAFNDGAVVGAGRFNAYYYIRPNTDNGIYYASGGAITRTPAIVNGTLAIAGQEAYRNGVHEGVTIGGWSSTNNDNLAIGARLNNGTPNLFFGGRVTHVAYYDQILTEQEVQAIYADIEATVTPTDELFYYDFEYLANGATWYPFPNWTSTVNWNVYQGSETGQTINIIYPASAGEHLLTTDVGISNVSVEVTVKEATGTDLAGSVARRLDDNNFILMEHVRSEGAIKLYIKQGAGNWTLLDSSTGHSFGGQTLNNYRLECNGNDLKGFYDDVEILSATLAGTENLGTGVGIYSGIGQPNFAAIRVKSL